MAEKKSSSTKGADTSDAASKAKSSGEEPLVLDNQISGSSEATGDETVKASVEASDIADDAVTVSEPEEKLQKFEDAPGPEDDQVLSAPPQDAGSYEPDPLAGMSQPEKKASALPMLLGGVLAGAIGFGAAYLWQSQDSGAALEDLERAITARIAAQDDQIAELSARSQTQPPALDISEMESRQVELEAALSALADQLDEAKSAFSDLDGRLSNLEKRPVAEGASDAAVAAYERELRVLQDAMEAQRLEIEAIATEAQQREESAELTAQATLRRAALTRVQTALDAGTGFAPALADLEATGTEIPDALGRVAQTGVASLAQLQDDFPDAARAVLAASRRAAAEEGDGGGFGTFLKSQLSARSLEPKEGDDPDAILSRAEAALREGRLTDVMAEIDALPDTGRAEIAPWAEQAMLRLEALAAAEKLGQDLN